MSVESCTLSIVMMNDSRLGNVGLHRLLLYN